MDRDEYQRMNRLETRMWWYRGLHRLLADTVGRRAAQARFGLDAGCGTGGLLLALHRRGAGTDWQGVEIDSQAAQWAQAKSGCPVTSATIEALPFNDARFDVAVSADVLCHALVAPERALGELARVLAPGGRLILNLPAYRWMLSRHDRAVQNVRRFTAGEVKAMLARHGFVAIRSTYWNTILFPLMALSRLLPALGSSGGAAKSDVMEYPALLDTMFSGALAVERFLLRLGVRLPFGGSLLVTAQKK
ncbi:MAG: class I SAM-dependent methyltransferase [Rhodospirillales bacterium]